VTVASPELSIKNNKIEINGTEIKILPSAVAAKAKIKIAKELNLSVEAGSLVYNVKGDENRKLFWIIPVTIEKQVQVDASTGDIIKEEKPWWSALTSSSD